MIKVLIVEDDPMVAEINKSYLRAVKGFECAGVAKNTTEAMEWIKKGEIELVLLDIFMPGNNGIDLLVDIRKEDQCVDAIVISAASDIQNIKSVLRLGVVDYLIKPFEFERFSSALKNYKNEYELISQQKVMVQDELDNQLLRQNKLMEQCESLPKGLTRETLQIVVENIIEGNKKPFTTAMLAEEIGVSRVSTRKYLKFLTEIEMVSVNLHYKKTGRPIHMYEVNYEKTGLITPYLKADLS
ncbi:response regulator [Halobacillus shinanisalinarum]|uniref:Response regulator n=1 Tax=Halobacillus shinanisalinarum TaxID=2932258 RepID=A0ABY4H7E7_9BACI|nr:response regulator [Halobacillus shinanisalinarum]UOQ94897.1 response regulator [Halobacillus shinanisalinarum]